MLKALRFLNCVDHSPSNYQEIKTHEREHNARFIGPILGRYWYMPIDTDPALVRKVIDRLYRPPADSEAVMRALGDLWLTTKKQKVGEAERDSTLHAYYKRLSAYPVEYAVLVLNHLAETEIFFPPWSLVRKNLEPIMSDRQTLITCLKRSIPHLERTE